MVRRVVLCAGLVAIASAATPCCDKKCELPLMKYFSTDAPHGFCGEACMDPKKFDIYHKFEANLTLATDDHPCSEQRTPDNAKHYTDYFDTVTHGLPHVLAVTLDLYAPKDMPDHSCCSTPLFHGINCIGKPKSMTISGTGPFCCPSSATETTPCSKEQPAGEAVPPAAKRIEELFCKVASLKMIEDKAAGMICAEIEKIQPKIPSSECQPLVEAGWEKLVAMCPKVAAPVKVADSTTPCCDKTCELPLVKYFSTDAPHGFCGEACMDPKKFSTYQKFEANLTRATSDHPCSEQYTPSNAKKYTDYFSTVTHGLPGVLAVTLDLYAPTNMADHSCCSTPLLHGINCWGKPTSVSIEGTGPFCCPKGATESTPCAKSSTIVI